jgi:hypothetical protein
MSMHLTAPIRWRFILVAAVALFAAALACARPAAADAAPTYDHWSGNLAVEYSNPGGSLTGNLLPYLNVSDVPSSLSDLFNSKLVEKTSAICDKMQDTAAGALGTSVPVEGWTCNLPTSGDLQASQDGNTVTLSYVVSGASFSLNTDKVPGGAHVDGSVDITATVKLVFPTQIGDISNKIQVAASYVTISNAKLTTANVLLNAAGVLPGIEQSLDGYTVPDAASLLGLDTQIDSVNSALGDGAVAAAKHVQPDGSLCLTCSADNTGTAANPVFDLSVTVDDSNLSLILSHGALQPKPAPCAFGSDGSSPALIYAECPANQPSGVTELDLMQSSGGSFGPVLTGYSEAGEWQSDSLLDSSGHWGPITNNGAPVMGGRQRNLDGVQTVTLTVCSGNKWGYNCDSPTSLTLQRNGVTDDAEAAYNTYLDWLNSRGSSQPPSGSGDGPGGGTITGPINSCARFGCRMM